MHFALSDSAQNAGIHVPCTLLNILHIIMHAKILPHFLKISLLLAQLHKLSYIHVKKKCILLFMLLNTTVNCYATKQMKKNIGLEMKEIFEKCILILVTF